MSVDRISAGLAQRERQTAGNTVPLANLAGAPKSLGELKETAASAMTKQQRLADMIAGITKTLETFEKRKRAEFDSLGKSRDDSGVVTDTLGADRRKKMLADTLKNERRRVLAVGAEQRAKLADELDELRQQAHAVASLYADPVASLKLGTLGSERRGSYSRDLASAGPVEVENALRRAVLTGDKDLAAAALARLDGMAKQQRDAIPINRREVAEALAGEESIEAKAAILRTEIAAESAAQVVAKIEGREVPSTKKVALGIKRRELAALVGEPDGADDDPEETTEPESEGYSVPADEALGPGESWVDDAA